MLKKSASGHRPWRVKRETCEKGATWTDWIPTSSRPSRQSRSASLLEHSPVVPDMRAIEIQAGLYRFSSTC